MKNVFEMLKEVFLLVPEMSHNEFMISGQPDRKIHFLYQVIAIVKEKSIRSS
jgi:hypothetical protein